MKNLDGTIIAIALPQMALSFRVSAVNLNIWHDGLPAYPGCFNLYQRLGEGKKGATITWSKS